MWNLTLSGTFNTSTTYKCSFNFLQDSLGDSTESVLRPAKNRGSIQTAAFRPASASALICTVQIFQYSESVTRLSVIDASSSSAVLGPGGTAELITFTAGWKSRLVTVGGTRACSTCSTGLQNSIACFIAGGASTPSSLSSLGNGLLQVSSAGA